MKRLLWIAAIILGSICVKAQQTNHLDALVNQLNYLEGKLKSSDQAFFGRATEGMQALYDAKDYLKAAGWPDFEGEDAQYNALADAFYKVKVAERKALLNLIDKVKQQLFQYKEKILNRFNSIKDRYPNQAGDEFQRAEDPIGTAKVDAERARLQRASQLEQQQRQQQLQQRQQPTPAPAPAPKPQPQYDYSGQQSDQQRQQIQQQMQQQQQRQQQQAQPQPAPTPPPPPPPPPPPQPQLPPQQPIRQG